MKRLLFILVAVGMLSACGTKTTEYYQEHPEERKAKLEECREMAVMEALSNKECTTAMNADKKGRLDLNPPKQNPLEGKGNTKERPKF
jgi:hypothetical protein